MGIPSGMELFVIVAVIVLLFGGKKIPELASGIGKGIKNFKKAMNEDDEVTTTTKKEEPQIENSAQNSSSNIEQKANA
jgi:sec-independent protein translocase protein TatA